MNRFLKPFVLYDNLDAVDRSENWFQKLFFFQNFEMNQQLFEKDYHKVEIDLF